MAVQSFYEKRPHPLLLHEGKMTKCGTPNCLNYWWNFNNIHIIYECFRGTHNTTWLFACGLRAAGWGHITKFLYDTRVAVPIMRSSEANSLNSFILMPIITTVSFNTWIASRSGIPRNFVRGRGGSTNSVEDRGQRERGCGGSSPLVRGSGGSCNFVQEISFHIVKFS
jgi:hypothetical protein